jgi:peptidoglycan hydrolase CwlO-like protein
MYKTIILSIITSILLVSCVTTGKYDLMVQWKDSLQTSSDSLQSIVTKTNETISNLYKQISEINGQKKNWEKNIYFKNYQSLKSASLTKLSSILTN